MGTVKGNIECSDRVDIRGEGSVAGDVSTMRISVEDGAVLKGGIEVRSGEQKKNQQSKSNDTQKNSQEHEHAMAAPVGA
jgi:cytoskeletal protein CcmA (bactofilin family)